MSSYENKVHVYSVDRFDLKFCIGNEIPINKILNYAFSKKNKFLSILIDDLTMEVFNISQSQNTKSVCICKLDTEKKKKSILYNIYSNIKVNIN